MARTYTDDDLMNMSDEEFASYEKSVSGAKSMPTDEELLNMSDEEFNDYEGSVSGGVIGGESYANAVAGLGKGATATTGYSFDQRQKDKIAASRGREAEYEGQYLVEGLTPFTRAVYTSKDQYEDENRLAFVNDKAFADAIGRHGYKDDDSLKGYKEEEIGGFGTFMYDLGHRLSAAIDALPSGFITKSLRGGARRIYNNRATDVLIDYARDAGFTDEDINKAKEYSQGNPVKMNEFFKDIAQYHLKKSGKIKEDAAIRLENSKEKGDEGILSKVAGGALDMIPVVEEFAVVGGAGKAIRNAKIAGEAKIAAKLAGESEKLAVATAKANEAARVAKLGTTWSGRIRLGLEHSKFMVPAMGTEMTRRRFGELTADDYYVDENGDLKVEAGDDVSLGTLAKAAAGGYGEAAIFSLPIGEATLGWASPLITGALKKKVGHSAALMYENYVKYGRLTGVRGAPVMQGLMNLNTFKDQALGLGVKGKDFEGYDKAIDQFWNETMSVENQADIFISTLGVMTAQGAVALRNARHAIVRENRSTDSVLKTFFEVPDDVLKQMTPEHKKLWRKLITAKINGSEYALTEENLKSYCDHLGRALGEKQMELATKMATYAVEKDNTRDWRPDVTVISGAGKFKLPTERKEGSTTPSVQWKNGVERLGTGEYVPCNYVEDRVNGIKIKKFLPTDLERSDDGFIYIVEDRSGRTATRKGIKDAVSAANDMIYSRDAVTRTLGKKAQYLKEIYGKYFQGENAEMVDTSEQAAERLGRPLGDGEIAFMDPKTGKQTYILERVKNPQQMLSTVLHEVGRHRGIQIALGEPQKQLDFLRGLSRSGDPFVERELAFLCDKYGIDEKVVTGKSFSKMSEEESAKTSYILNEIYGHMFNREGIPDPTEWDKHVAAFRGMLRKVFRSLPVSRAEAEALYRGSMDEMAKRTGGELRRETGFEYQGLKDAEFEDSTKMAQKGYEDAINEQLWDDPYSVKGPSREYGEAAQEAEFYERAERRKEDFEAAIQSDTMDKADEADQQQRHSEREEGIKEAFDSADMEKAVEDQYKAQMAERAKQQQEKRAREHEEAESRKAERISADEERQEGDYEKKRLAQEDAFEKLRQKRLEEARKKAHAAEIADHEKRLAEAEKANDDAAYEEEMKKWDKEWARIEKEDAEAREQKDREEEEARDQAEFDKNQGRIEEERADRARENDKAVEDRKEEKKAEEARVKAAEETADTAQQAEREKNREGTVEAFREDSRRRSIEGAEKKAEEKKAAAEYERKESERILNEILEESMRDEPVIQVETGSDKTKGKPGRVVRTEFRGKSKSNPIEIEEEHDRNGNLVGWNIYSAENGKGKRLITSVPGSSHSASSKRQTIGEALKASENALKKYFGDPEAKVGEVATKIDEMVDKAEPTVAEENAPETIVEKDKKENVPASFGNDRPKENSGVFNGRTDEDVDAGVGALDNAIGLIDRGVNDEEKYVFDLGDVELDFGSVDTDLSGLDPNMQMYNREEDVMSTERAEGNRKMVNIIAALHSQGKVRDFDEFARLMAEQNRAFFDAHESDLAAVWNYASHLTNGRVPKVGEVGAKDSVRSAATGKNVRDISDVGVLQAIERETDVTMMPAKEINGSDDRIPNLKRGANSKTGIEKELPGRPRSLLSKPIVAVEFEDGEVHVVTGRHRRDLYARHDMDVPVRILREKDGWVTKRPDGTYDLSKVRAIDALDNIQDGKGRIEDYVDFFREYDISREKAEKEGFIGSREARFAYAIAKEATPDLRQAINFDGGKKKGFITPEQAGAIADAAPRSAKEYNSAVQRAVLKDVLADPTMDPTDIKIDANEASHDYEKAKAQSGTEQGMFDFGMGDPEAEAKMAEERQRRRDFIRDKIAEYSRLAKDIRAAKNSNNGLTIRRDDMRKLGINEREVAKGGIERRRELEAAASKAEMRAYEWGRENLKEADRAELDAYMNGGDAEGREKAFREWCESKGKKPTEAMRMQYEHERSKAESEIANASINTGSKELFYNKEDDLPENLRRQVKGIVDRAVMAGVPFKDFLAALDKKKPGAVKAIGPALADVWNNHSRNKGIDTTALAEYNDYVNKIGGTNDGGSGGGPSGQGTGTGNAGQPRVRGPGKDVQQPAAPTKGDGFGKGNGKQGTPSSDGSGVSKDPKADEGAGGNGPDGGSDVPSPSGNSGLDADFIRKNQYHPAKFKVDGMKASDSLLEESEALHYTEPPDIDDTKIAIPADLIKRGELQEHQLEAIAYAQKVHDGDVLPDGSRKAIVYGHGAGSGKGRMIAGTILNNVEQGRKLNFWITKNSGLREDAKRDLKPFGLSEDLFSITGNIPSEGVGFGTYDDLKRSGFIDNFVKRVGEDFDGVIAFDESHMAKTPYSVNGKGVEKGLTQKAVVELQKRLPKARIVYASATFAQGVENLGYATRLGLWGKGTAFEDFKEFSTTFSRKGTWGMEMASRSLKRRGQYFSCQLSKKGIKYGSLEVKTTEEQKQAYRRYNKMINDIYSGINEALLAMENLDHPAWSSIAGMQQRMHNSMFSAMKLPMAIEAAKKDLAEGRSPVFSLVFTNEAGAGREVAKAQAEGMDIEMDEANFGPKQIILDFLTNKKRKTVAGVTFEDTQFPTMQVVQDPDTGEVTGVKENAEAVAKRAQLLEAAKKLDDVFGNPINMIMDAFGKDNVANLTGINKSNFDRDYKDYQDGKRMVIVFSKKAGTGFTFSSDRKYKNQAQRVMYPLQPGWRADDYEQAEGRVHRNNQASLPWYFSVSTDIPGERRFVSTVARRQADMNAFSKGDRYAGGGLIDIGENIEDKYASIAVKQIIQHLINNGQVDVLAAKMNFLKTDGDGNTINALLKRDKNSNAIVPADIKPGQFLNRMMLLDPGVQDGIITALERFRAEAIKIAKEEETYDPGLQESGSVRDDMLQSVKIAPDMSIEHVNSWRKTARKTYDEFMEAHKNDVLQFFRDKISGEVFAVKSNGTKGRNRHPAVDVYGVDGSYDRALASTYTDGKSFEKIPETEVKAAWDAEYGVIPEERATDMFFTNGDLYNHWDRIAGDLIPHTYIVGRGTKEGFVGVPFGSDSVYKILKAYGKGVEGRDMVIDSVVRQVLNNRAVELKEGWTLKGVPQDGKQVVMVRGFESKEAAAEAARTLRVNTMMKFPGVEFRADKKRVFFPADPKLLEHIIEQFPANIYDRNRVKLGDTGTLFMNKADDIASIEKSYEKAIKDGDVKAQQNAVAAAAARAVNRLSDVVSINGVPDLFVHETNADFNSFDVSLNDSPMYGRGIYFSRKEGAGYGKRAVKAYVLADKVFDWGMHGDFPYEETAERKLSAFAKAMNKAGVKVDVDKLYKEFDVKNDPEGDYLEEDDVIGTVGVDVFTDALKKLGYKGTTGNSGSELIVFDPNVIKSADPITYDDEGNVVPLSKRFDLKKNDVRFMNRDEDVSARHERAVNEGDDKAAKSIVMDTLRRAMPDSKITRGKKLLEVYHGTINEFTKFSGDVFWFSPSRKYASGYGDGMPERMSGYVLNITNPLDTRVFGKNFLDQPIAFWSKSDESGRPIYENWSGKKYYGKTADMDATRESPLIKQLSEATGISIDRLIEIGKEASNDGIIRTLSNVYSIVNKRSFAEEMMRRGYDGIIGEEYGNRTFGAFRPEQVKSTEPATFDDSGNLIPLSKRADMGNADFRFMNNEDDVHNYRSQRYHTFTFKGTYPNASQWYEMKVVGDNFRNAINRAYYRMLGKEGIKMRKGAYMVPVSVDKSDFPKYGTIAGSFKDSSVLALLQKYGKFFKDIDTRGPNGGPDNGNGIRPGGESTPVLGSGSSEGSGSRGASAMAGEKPVGGSSGGSVEGVKTGKITQGEFSFFNVDEDAALRLGNKKLEEAIRLSSSGAPDKEVWDETGFWKGADGKWRYEISPIKYVKNDHLKKVLAGDVVRLADAVNSPDLFKAYPKISDVTVRIDEKAPKGFAQARGMEIVFGSDAAGMSNKDFTRVLNHEVQHVIQNMSGFSRGTSPGGIGDFSNARSEAIRIVAERHGISPSKLEWFSTGLGDLKRIASEYGLGDHEFFKKSARPDGYYEMDQDGRDRFDAADALNHSSMIDSNPLYKDLLSKIPVEGRARIKKAAEDMVRFSNMHAEVERILNSEEFAKKNWYRDSAGEVEARQQEKRYSMNAKERGNREPWLDEDVSRKDQFVDFHDVKKDGSERALTERDGAQFFNIDEDAAKRIRFGKKDEAEKMLAAGEDRKKIWEKTGWWKGKDGKWRAEIKGVTEAEFSEMADVIKNSGRFFDRDSGSTSINSYAFTFGDLESELHKIGKKLPDSMKVMLTAYPKLKDQRIVLDYKTPKTAEELATLGYSSSKEIRLYKGGMNSNTFNHEVQHKMQEFGGMARGTNTNGKSSDRYQHEHGEWEARLAAKRATMTDEERAAEAPWESREEAGVSEDSTLIDDANMRRIRKDGEPEPPPKPDPFALRDPTKWDRYHTNLTDRYHPILEMERDGGRDKSLIYKNGSPYNAMRLLPGHQEKARVRYETQWKRPYEKLLKQYNITDDQVGRYMIAMDVEARNRKVLDRNGTLNGSGMSDQDAKDFLVDMERSLSSLKMNGIKKAARLLWDMQEEGLKRRVQSGRLDEATYEKWKKEEPFHVPMRDDYSEDGEPAYSTKQWKRFEFKTAEGRSDISDNPVEFMMREYQEAMYGSNENEARKVLARYVATRPGIGKVKKGVRRGNTWSFTHGQVEEVPDPFYFEQRVRGGAGKPNLIAFKDGGNLMMIEMAGKMGERVAEAVTGRGVWRAPKIVNTVMRPYASFATEWSPTFIGRNFTADMLEAALNTISDKGIIKGGYSAAKNVAMAIAMEPTIWKYNKDGKFTGKYADVMRRYVESGASIGGASVEGFNELKIEMDHIRSGRPTVKQMAKLMMRALSMYNKQAELATRLAVFKDCIDSGYSDGEAAMRSREYSTDFNKYGNKRWMNTAWMFSGSVIGSAVRQVESFARGKHGIQGLTALVTLGVLERLLEHVYNSDDDEVAKEAGKPNAQTMTEYARANSVYFRFGDRYVRIPFHAGPFSVAKYIGNSAMALALGDIDEKQFAKQVSKEIIDTGMHFTGTGDAGPDIKQSLFPTLLVPFFQHEANKDFAGRPIKKEMYSKTKPYSENGRESTGKAYKYVARKLNEWSGGNEKRRGQIDIAPETLKLAWTSLFKNSARDVEAIYDTIMDAMDGEMNIEHIPYVRDFVRKVPDNTQVFYKVKDRFDADIADGTLKFGSGKAVKIRKSIQKIDDLRHWADGQKKVKGQWKHVYMSDGAKEKWHDMLLKEQQKVIDAMEE